MYVTFFARARQNFARSEAAGRPVFEEKTYVRILKPGGQRIERPMQAADETRFAAAWDAYLKGHTAAEEGLPLGEWAQITLSEAEALKSIGVRTVEDLAAANNDVKKTYGRGIISLINRAKTYLEAERAPEKMAARLRELEDKIDLLGAELKERDAALARQTKATDTRKQKTG